MPGAAANLPEPEPWCRDLAGRSRLEAILAAPEAGSREEEPEPRQEEEPIGFGLNEGPRNRSAWQSIGPGFRFD